MGGGVGGCLKPFSPYPAWQLTRCMHRGLRWNKIFTTLTAITVSVMRATVRLRPHIETKTWQQLSLTVHRPVHWIHVVRLFPKWVKVKTAHSTLCILHILRISAVSVGRSNTYCKMHTLCSKRKKEMLNKGASQDSSLPPIYLKDSLLKQEWSLWRQSSWTPFRRTNAFCCVHACMSA